MVPPILQSLPSPLSLGATASYELTVAPYFVALTAYPNAVIEAITSKTPVDALWDLYITANPLVTSAVFAVVLMPIFFVASEVNRNYSQVDRFWSILPVIFNGHYALWKHLSVGSRNEFGRTDAVALVVLIWGIRLTSNYWRRGGYKIGTEDYRWEVLQEKIGSLLFFLFNVIFISSAQIFLLLSIAFPTFVLLLSERVTGPGLTPTDIGFSAWIIFLVALTATADQQQWNFHKAKHAYQATGKAQDGYHAADLAIGFNTTGLFRYSRHPNFTTEQAVWVSLYAWSCVITKSAWNWSGVGALGYLILFQASTWFTELISMDKYPEYKNYQKHVSRFIPLPGYHWSLSRSTQAAAKHANSKKRH